MCCRLGAGPWPFPGAVLLLGELCGVLRPRAQPRSGARRGGRAVPHCCKEAGAALTAASSRAPCLLTYFLCADPVHPALFWLSTLALNNSCSCAVLIFLRRAAAAWLLVHAAARQPCWNRLAPAAALPGGAPTPDTSLLLSQAVGCALQEDPAEER